MNPEIKDLCSKLIPESYVLQGVQARSSHEHKIKQLLQHVSKIYSLMSPWSFFFSLIKCF